MTMIHLDDPEGRYSQGNGKYKPSKAERKIMRKARRKALLVRMWKVISNLLFLVGGIAAILEILNLLHLLQP